MFNIFFAGIHLCHTDRFVIEGILNHKMVLKGTTKHLLFFVKFDYQREAKIGLQFWPEIAFQIEGQILGVRGQGDLCAQAQ